MSAPITVPVIDAAHASSPERVLAGLGVDPLRGLAADEAVRRLAAVGANELERQRPDPWWRLVVRAMLEPFVVLLAVSGVLAVALGEVRDGLLVLMGLVPIVGADVITTYRGDRALDALREAAAPRARVRRDGSVREVPAATVVPGDLVLLQVGDVVPADMRITTASGLLLDRSIITGESLPEPATAAPDDRAAGPADRHALAYSGCSVVGGRGEGVVISTGSATELGRTASALVPGQRTRSPLQRELDRLVGILLVVAIGLIVITLVLGFVRGQDLGVTVLAAISAAIAAIPEEPPILLAVILGLGAYRLLRRGVLVRRLSAQETLGAVDLIVTDKTGTLTENRLSLSGVLTPDGRTTSDEELLPLAVDALRAEEDAWGVGAGARPGSFTRSLIAVIEQLGGDPRVEAADLLDAQAADERHPYSSTRARRDGRVEELALGAPEAVLHLADDDGRHPLDAWHDLIAERATEGSRLLLLARRDDGGAWQPRAVFEFSDQVRPGVPEALARATDAGIHTIMVTGDHALTARTIARQAGMPDGDLLTGAQLEPLDDAALRAALPGLRVVARAIPQQKLRLVEAAMASGHTVAVTGDGVNDAPALHRADVAVAMGSGTAVAREASDLVLGDDSFVTLMDGLAEGRRIVDNVQKGLVFLVSTHVALLGFLLVATLANIQSALLPLQILWLELFIDSVTAVAFERERAEPDVMRRAPRLRHVPLLTQGLLLRTAIAGGITLAAAFAVLVTHGDDPEHARWLAYTTLVIGQVVRANANRSLTRPITTLGVNGVLLAASGLVIGIQLLIPYVPALASAFHATPLAADDLALVAAIALAPALLAEVIRRTGRVWVA